MLRPNLPVRHNHFLDVIDKDYWKIFDIFVKSTLNITAMNSKRKDLQYASVFLLAVALTFLMGKGDNLWLISWGDLDSESVCAVHCGRLSA